MHLRSVLYLLAVLSLVVTQTARADITVGVITSLTGPSASVGTLLQKALATVPHEVDGQKINYIVLDDATDPSLAVRDARKLITEKNVDIILGPTTAPGALAVASVVNELKVPQISSAPFRVPADKMGWVFIVSQPADIWLTPVAEDMHASGAATVGYIGFSDAWGDLCYAGLTRLAPASHLKVISNERYARSDTSVTAQVLRLLANKPDVIFIGGSGSAGALPELALQKMGWKGRTYNTPGVFDRDFLRVGGTAVEGVVAPTGPGVYAAQLPDDNPIKPVGLAFVRKYEAANGVGTANYIAGNAYDSTLIVVDAAKRALKQAKPGSPEFRLALRDAILQVHELAGVNGVYNYHRGSPYGVDNRAVILMRVVQGQWRIKK